MSQKEFSNEMFQSSFSMYVKVLVFLLILTAITFLQPIVIPTTLDGTLGMQLSIALVKAYLILAYYMHLKYESSLFKNILYFTITILIVFFIILGIDASHRDSPDDMFQQSTMSRGE